MLFIFRSVHFNINFTDNQALLMLKCSKAINELLEFLIEILVVALVGFCRLKLLNDGRIPRRSREK